MGCNCGNKSKSMVSSVPVDTGVHKSSCGGEPHKCSCGKEHHECKCGGEHNHECKCGSHACVQDHSTTLVESVYTTTVEVTHDFTMPAVDECVQLHLKDVTNLLPGAVLWNQSVGYLHVKSYDSTTGYATACNQGEENNAEAGSTFPSCMSFTVGIPTHCECNNTSGVCLAADMTSPGEGDQTEVSVTTVSGLFQGDIIDIAGYLYRITAITNVNSIIVKNEGFGAPIGTVIKNDPNCTGRPCTVPITVVNSDDPCTQNEVHSGVMIVCDEGVKRPFTGTANTQVPVWDDTNKVWIPKTVRLADACTNLTKELLLDPLVVTYIVYVETTNLFQINDHVEIDGTQYTVTSILGPTQMRITTNTAPAGVQVIDAGTAICRLDDSGECNACERITDLESLTYSGFNTGDNSMKYAVSLDFTEGSTDGFILKEGDTSKTLTSLLPTITLANPNTNGKSITLLGSVMLMCQGEFHTDTHTHSHATYTEGYRYLSTADGPSIEVTCDPYINTSPLYNMTITSGKEYYLALDDYTSKLPPVSTETSRWNFWSRSITIPIVHTITNPSSTNTLTFNTVVRGYNLHDGSVADTKYNENIRVRIKNAKIVVALAWILQ